MIIGNYKDKKIIEYLDSVSYGKIFFIFNHGLGDVINFIPIIEELKKRYVGLEFFIGIESKRNLSILNSNIFLYNKDEFIKLKRRFTYFFKINYREPVDISLSKPELCIKDEFGLKGFTWKPYKLKTNLNIKLDRVGVHFFGNTNQQNKSLNTEQANILWDWILYFGKKPFEIHNPRFNVYGKEGFDFYKHPNTIRFNNPGIKEIVNEISKCEYFIGIDSGLFYLAMSILGPERCIGIEKNYSIEKYAPIKIKRIQVKENWEKKELDKLHNYLKEN